MFSEEGRQSQMRLALFRVHMLQLKFLNETVAILMFHYF